MSNKTSPSTPPTKGTLEIAYSPIKVMDVIKDGINGDDKTEWATRPNCLDSCVYTVWDSADDYNMIVSHVGGDAQPTDCCVIYTSRLFGHCGGVCHLNDMAVNIKRRYEIKHNIQHQENPYWTCCCPEILWRQVIREHTVRYGTRIMKPAVNDHMVRG